MKILVRIFGFLLVSITINAQILKPIELTEQINYGGMINAKEQTEIYIDSSGKTNIKEIDKRAFISLKNVHFKPKTFEYYGYRFWLKLKVINPTKKNIKILFSVESHKTIQIYRKLNGNFTSIGSGNQELLGNSRPFRYDERYIPLSFEPNQEYELLISFTKQPNLFFKIEPKFVSFRWEYENKVRAFYDEYFYIIINLLYLAVLFFVGTYILFLYFIERRRYYLYYSLYLLILLLFGFWSTEHSPYFQFLLSFLPVLKYSSTNNMYVLISNIFYFLFIREFLEVEKISKRLNRLILIYVKFFMLPLLIADITANFILQNFTFALNIWLISQPIISFFGIYGTYEILRLKGSLARYIKFGTVSLLIGALIGFSEQIWLTKPSNFVILRLVPSLGFDIGVLIEILFFTTALGFKSFLIQKEKNKLERAVKESELQTLRSQINPHFVFNSLNSIKSYILKHQSKEAAEYLTDFSTLMRSILQHSKEQLIPLNDELETSLLYIKLEKLRFEDNFEFMFECDPEIELEEVMIPPLLLQPYIENAIKHGLMNKIGKRELKISVKQASESIIIQIEDNGIGRAKASQLHKNTPKHQSMGMNLNKERVELLNITNDFDITIEIEDKIEGTLVKIRLPLY